MDKLVTIAICDHPGEAHVIKMFLEQEGLEVFLADDHIVGTNWFYSPAVGGAKLQVLESKAAAAAAFVEEYRQRARERRTGDGEADIVFACEECGQRLSFPGHRRGGVETCPHCHAYVDVPE